MSMALSLLLSLSALLAVAFGGGKPFTDQPSIDAFLKYHNDERASFGVGPMAWDASLATLAVHQADLNCASGKATHDTPFNRQHKVGQNANKMGYSPKYKAWHLPSGPDMAKKSLDTWIAEKKKTNNYVDCLQKGCGHFSQVVWAASTRVGCAVAYDGCKKNGEWDNCHVVCNYQEQANYPGVNPLTAKSKGGGSSSPAAPAPSAPSPAASNKASAASPSRPRPAPSYPAPAPASSSSTSPKKIDCSARPSWYASQKQEKCDYYTAYNAQCPMQYNLASFCTGLAPAPAPAKSSGSQKIDCNARRAFYPSQVEEKCEYYSAYNDQCPMQYNLASFCSGL